MTSDFGHVAITSDTPYRNFLSITRRVVRHVANNPNKTFSLQNDYMHGEFISLDRERMSGTREVYRKKVIDVRFLIDVTSFINIQMIKINHQSFRIA